MIRFSKEDRDMEGQVELEDATGVRETDAALLVEYEGDEQWIPKKLIHDDSEVYEEGHTGTLVIPEWKAEELGWS
jgi:hypothetical protein